MGARRGAVGAGAERLGASGGIEGVRNGLEFGQAQIDVVGAAARVNLDVHPNAPAPIDAVHCGGILRAHKHAQHAILLVVALSVS